MRMFPALKVIVAHMGQWETRRHLELMPGCPNMYLDTTAAMAAQSPIYLGGGASPADVTDEDLVRWQDRVVFGSDFPNTPYPYEEERRPVWERALPAAVYRRSSSTTPGVSSICSRMAPRVALAAIPESGRRALGLLVELAGADRPLWLVGGAVRQLLAAEPLGDLDVAVRSGASRRARAGGSSGGSFVVLDESRGAGRVVGAGASLSVDVVDFRAATLADDLRARDFTVNALAVPLAGLVRDASAEVIDATGGLADLAERVVRACGSSAIADDPVRALRGVRLATGWLAPRAGTEAAIRAGVPFLTDVAVERARDELVAILGELRAAVGLRTLDRLGALTVLLPESGAMRSTSQPLPHRFYVRQYSIRTVEGVDALLADLDALAPWGVALREHLREPLGGGIVRREMLRLAALLHDVAKPETRTEQAADPLLRARCGWCGPDRRHRGAPPAAPAGEPGAGAGRGRAPAADAPGPGGADHSAGALPILPRSRRRRARSPAPGPGGRGRAHRRLAAGGLGR